MVDPIDANRGNWDERATTHARDTTGDYMLDRFRAGEDALHAIEAAELGDIYGKRVLHLQCHIGRDTLCLVRRGAVATGLDFSGVALDVARHLSSEPRLKADFVQATVDEAPHLTPGPFDLVFTTWGTICWLPGMTVWARVIASVLVPRGELYFADAHPSFLVLEEHVGRPIGARHAVTAETNDRHTEISVGEPVAFHERSPCLKALREHIRAVP